MEDTDWRLQELAAASALTEWQRAMAWEERLYAWHQANPDAPYWEAEEWARGQGIPGILEPGRIRWMSTRSGDRWQALKLQHGSPCGRWMIQCRQCGGAALVNSPMTGSGRCPNCRADELERRAAVKAERRIERRRERSAELKNRQGLCLVCHSPMTVARVTRTTCSDRCRKQWIRKGAEAFPLPPAAATVKLSSDGPELSLADARQQLSEQYDRLDRAYVQGALAGENTDSLRPAMERTWAAIDRVDALIARARLREEAPAIYLAEVMNAPE